MAFSSPHGFLFPLRSLVSASGSRVSNSPWSHGHTQSPQTAAHCHRHRCQSCGASICGICGACGGSGSSCPQSQERSQQGLVGSTVLDSLGGTWAMRGTWEGAGTAAGSAARTSRLAGSGAEGESHSESDPGPRAPLPHPFLSSTSFLVPLFHELFKWSP